MSKFNAVRVFSATMVHDRERLGETITEWLAANPKIEVVEIVDLARSSRPDMRRRVS